MGMVIFFVLLFLLVGLPITRRKAPARKTCKVCGVRFTPTSKHNDICPDCEKNRREQFEAEWEQKKQEKKRQQQEEHEQFISANTINGRYVHAHDYPGKHFDYFDNFHVVGVTFKNGRRHRQTILRQIKFKDPPYSSRPTFSLKKYEFDGEDAIAVYANEEMVGNISKNDLPWLLAQWDEYLCVDDYEITGGGQGKNYGLIIKVCFKKR